MTALLFNLKPPKMPFHKHIFGFTSIDDFVYSVTGLKYKLPALCNLLLSIEVSLLTLAVSFIEKWIWSPPYTLAFYMVVVAADFFSGLMVGVTKRKEGFLTQKALRLPIILVCHLVLLGMFYNAERINSDLGATNIDSIFFKGISRAAYFYILGVYSLSFVKNAVMLGYFKGAVADFFKKYIDTQKNIDEDK